MTDITEFCCKLGRPDDELIERDLQCWVQVGQFSVKPASDLVKEDRDFPKTTYFKYSEMPIRYLC